MADSTNALKVKENLPEEYNAVAPALHRATAIVTWDFVEETARQIRNLRGEINAAEKNIAIGGSFAKLRSALTNHTRHDRNAPGWVNIFAGPEGRRRFGCDRRIAEKHTQAWDAFGPRSGMIVPLQNLPSSFTALALLARLALNEKFPASVLARYLDEKRIHSASTEREIKRIGVDLGIVQRKSKKRIPERSEEPALTVMPELMWAWRHASEKDRLDLIESIDATEILKSSKQRSEMQERLEGQQRALGTLIKRVA